MMGSNPGLSLGGPLLKEAHALFERARTQLSMEVQLQTSCTCTTYFAMPHKADGTLHIMEPQLTILFSVLLQGDLTSWSAK